MMTDKENDIDTVLVPQDGTTGNKRRFPLKNSSRTVLSSFDTIDFPHVLAAKEEMKSWKFLQLNPEDLRQPTNKSTGDDVISSSGKNIAAALHRTKLEDEYKLKEISRKLQSFLPNFTNVDVIDDKENKQFLIKLKDIDKKEYTSRVLSEGTLRMLALCILEFDSKHTGLLCFEEPENGIHPFRIKSIIELLKDLSTDFLDTELPLRQVIVNTHSPVFVQHIYDWSNDKNVSLYYAEMRNRITDIQTERLKINTTMILPVLKEKEKQLELFSIKYSEQDLKMTISKVKQYLESNSNIS
jgi:predicted ATPase